MQRSRWGGPKPSTQGSCAQLSSQKLPDPHATPAALRGAIFRGKSGNIRQHPATVAHSVNAVNPVEQTAMEMPCRYVCAYDGSMAAAFQHRQDLKGTCTKIPSKKKPNKDTHKLQQPEPQATQPRKQQTSKQTCMNPALRPQHTVAQTGTTRTQSVRSPSRDCSTALAFTQGVPAPTVRKRVSPTRLRDLGQITRVRHIPLRSATRLVQGTSGRLTPLARRRHRLPPTTMGHCTLVSTQTFPAPPANLHLRAAALPGAPHPAQ